MLRQVLLSSFLIVNQINLFPILLLKVIATHAQEENLREPYNIQMDRPWNDYNYDNAYMQYYPYQPPLTQGSSMNFEDRRIDSNFDAPPKNRRKSQKKYRKKFDMENFNSFMSQVPFYSAMETTLPQPDLASDISPQAYYPYSMPYFYPDFATPMPPLDSENGTFLGFPWMLDSFFGNFMENEFGADEKETDTETATATTILPDMPTTIETEVQNSTEMPETTTEMDIGVETTTMITDEETPTTTLPPFTIADVKVPIPFLRIEYMISFCFFGLMYGLGFFVLFQSLCVPAAKIAVTLVYLVLVKLKAIDPVTLEQALEQLPPT